MASTTMLGLTLTLTPPMITALRIAPLISSTASLTHAYMEWHTVTSFLSPTPIDSPMSKFLIGAATSSPSPSTEDSSAESKPNQANLDKELAQSKNIVVPEWFTTFFNTGVLSVIGLNSLTLISASLNLFVFPQGLGKSEKYYTIGLVAAAAHYFFVPLIGGSVMALVGMCAKRLGRPVGEKAGKRVREGREAVEWTKEWVGFHKVRMMTVDVVAWVGFGVGCVGAVGL